MDMGSGPLGASGSSDPLNGLKFGKKIYFEDAGSCQYSSSSSPGAKKGRGTCQGGGGLQQQQPPRCQVEGCGEDLTGEKAYYCRHKVCIMHSKSPKVVVAGLEQRFCQQCSRGPEMGLFLNIKKTELFWPSCDGQKIREGLFPIDIGRSRLGVKLLGGAVSRDKDFIEELAMMRATKAVDLMHLLPQLDDPQSELLLLRSCMGTTKLMFGLRTCQPTYMKQAAAWFDKGLRGAIEDIVVCGGPFFGDLQWRVASLPIRLGGLGLYSAIEASSYAFVASRAQSWMLQDHMLRDSGLHGMDSDFLDALEGLRVALPSIDITHFASKDTVPPKAQNALASSFFSKIVKDMEAEFDMSARQKAIFHCLQAEHAQDFLLAIPIEGLGLHMLPIEYRSILKYRLMIPIFPPDEACPVCYKSCLDAFGDHAVHCHELPGFKYRHDIVRDVLFDILRHAGVSSKKEAPVNFLTDPQEGRSTLRPADVLIFGWVGGKHACVDLTGVSPLVGLIKSDFVARGAAQKAALAKVAKHEKACIDNQHVFIPFGFDTFGFLASEAVELLKRIQKIMHSNVMVPKSMNVVFRRIGFAIQKGLAAQLVARLPSIPMFHQLPEFDQGKRSCRRRLAGHNERRRKPPSMPFPSRYGQFPSSFHDDGGRYGSFLMDLAHPGLQLTARQAWPNVRSGEQVTVAHWPITANTATSPGRAGATQPHPSTHSSAAGMLFSDRDIPPDECLEGSHSSCALSLLSNQSWGTAALNARAPIMRTSHFHSNHSMAEPIIPNNIAGNAWGFKGHEVCRTMPEPHLQICMGQDAEPIVGRGQLFPGELELALQGSSRHVEGHEWEYFPAGSQMNWSR